MTRRQALIALGTGASVLAQSKPTIEPAIVTHHDEAVDRTLKTQITDSKSRGYGNLPTATSIYQAGSAAGIVETLVAAYAQPLSRFYHDNLLVERMRLAAAWLDRAQHPDGFIDYFDTNFDSPPDTGFVVHPLATATCLAQRAGHREIVAVLEPFLRKAAGGLATGGIHTPNHRWVVCAALAQVHELFPDPRYLRRIDQWLAEGIDIDEEGQFTERSTSVYNAVCDRAFVVLAAKLKRPELLAPVRKNLDAMMYLLHPDYDVVTEISHRQDRGVRGTMARYWFPLRYLAVTDSNGVYATVANHLTPAFASLSALMEYPEIVGPMPAPAEPPDNYVKELPRSGIVRYRRGATSATLAYRDPSFFALRRGTAVIESIRFASAFFGKGQFIPALRSGQTLTQELVAGYYQPVTDGKKVTQEQWASARASRGQTQVCKLMQSASVVETRNGFDVRILAAGTDGVPVSIEITLREDAQISGCEQLQSTAWLLSGSRATLRSGSNEIRFGPGLAEHRYVDVRGSLPRIPGQTVYLTGFTPVDHALHIECAG